MKLTQNLKRILSALLVFVLVVSMMPVTALAAANSSRRNDVIFFATDYHQLPSRLTALLNGLTYEPGLVVLGGDFVESGNTGSLLSISDKVHSIFPNAQTFYTVGCNDANVTEEGTNRYAFARTGEYLTGEDYYVYPVDYSDMASAASASAASAQFVSWANGADASKVIFVMCHMPIHQRSGENLGGAVWMDALNTVGQSHDVVFLWGYNHLNETQVDKSVAYVANGGSLTPEGGSTNTINFTYVNAGYIRSGYGTMVIVNDNDVSILRNNVTGSTVSTHTMERKFVGHIHNWYLTGTVDATCAEEGSKTYTCTGCGETKTETIHATGEHTNNVTYTSATCLESGTVTHTCTVCGRTATAETDKPLGHDLITYEIGNYIVYTCQRCGVPQDMVQKPGEDEHELYVDLSKSTAPTCTKDGIAFYVCRENGCAVTKEEIVPATGHILQTITRKPSCAEAGVEYYDCINCEYVESVTLPAQDHVIQTVRVNPTCTTEGSVTTTCANCDYYNVEVIPATGHTEESVTTFATCARNGAIVTTCSDCGESNTEVIPATGHEYESTTVAATCTTMGFTKHTCTSCDSYYKTNTVEALGHSYSEIVTAPTCLSFGFTRKVCSTCGDSTVIDQVPALGHSYEAVKDGSNMVYTCKNCDDSYTEAIADSSAYERVTKLTNGDSFVITLYSNKNFYALSHKDNTITAVQVTVENNEIVSEVTADLLWNFDNKKLSYTEDGTTNYLAAASSKASINATGSNITYSSNKLKVGTKYLRFSSNAISLSSSSTTSYLFKQAD